MKHWDNYIFDLYGTLIDIWTDERSASLWQRMAELYAVYGARWRPEELRESYLRLCDEAEAQLRLETGSETPEIELGAIFERLLDCAPQKHPCHDPRPEGLGAFLANCFRVLSRKRFGIFPNTLETLAALREKGCGIYLLSNAQHVFTMPEMEQLGLPPYFHALYFSSDARLRKPEPRFLRRLLETEGLDPERCVMVGNSVTDDIASALSCGVSAVLLNTDGYGPEQLSALPCPSIEDLSELLR